MNNYNDAEQHLLQFHQININDNHDADIICISLNGREIYNIEIISRIAIIGLISTKRNSIPKTYMAYKF